MTHLFQHPFLTANISVTSPGYRSEYPVRSADLLCAFISDSIEAFTGVSAKIALTRFSLTGLLTYPCFWESSDVNWTFVMLVAFRSRRF